MGLVDLPLYVTALPRGLLFFARDKQLLSSLVNDKKDASVVLLEEKLAKGYA